MGDKMTVPMDINDRFEEWASRPEIRYDVNFAGYEKWASAMDGFKGGWFERQKEIDNLKALLAEIGVIANAVRARDGAPPGYGHDYFDELVSRIHKTCDGDALQYTWKKLQQPREQLASDVLASATENTGKTDD